MRLIDANALIAKLKTQYGEELGWQCTVNMSDVGMMIEDAPTVDAVEVVRCKNCVHYGGVTFGFMCRKFSGIDTKICMHADGYCSYGERKVSE